MNTVRNGVKKKKIKSKYLPYTITIKTFGTLIYFHLSGKFQVTVCIEFNKNDTVLVFDLGWTGGFWKQTERSSEEEQEKRWSGSGANAMAEIQILSPFSMYSCGFSVCMVHSPWCGLKKFDLFIYLRLGLDKLFTLEY